jgi:hypothetical protein
MTEDDVIGDIQALVTAGEYVDELLGLPGVRLSGGGAFKGNRRIYSRGTPEHLRARAAGLLEKLPPPTAPASRAAVEQTERHLGYPLPRLLRRLYLEVGNGGFGPGYGLIGLGEAERAGNRGDDLQGAPWQRAGSASAALLAVCSWGCGIYSLVDCASAEARMWAWDPNPVAPADLGKALLKEELSLCQWLGRWVNGRCYQPCLLQDPATGEWRGASEGEKAELAALLSAEA